MLDRNIELVHTKTKATNMDSSQYSGQFLGGRGRREGWSGGQLPHQAAGQQDWQASLFRLGGSTRIPIESLSDHSAQVDLDIGDYHMENNKGFTKVRTSRAKFFKVSISFLQGRLWQVFRVEGRAQRLVNCQAGLLLPMNALVACMIHNAWNTLKTYPDCKSIQSCKYITIHIQWTCVLFFKQ